MNMGILPGGPDKRAAFAQNPLSAPEFHGGGFDAPFLLGPELFLAQFWIQVVSFRMLLESP